MPITYVNNFLLRNASLTAYPILFHLLGFLEFFFFNISLPRISKFFSRSRSSLQYQLISLTDNSRVVQENQESNSSRLRPSFNDKESLRREEVEMVMGKLGIFCHSEAEKLQERLSCDDVFKLFEEEEPKLGEMESAFDVFDENRDGFIDARELHRVLSALGLKDELDMETCKRMISVFDENGDGRIDFNEFVNLME